MWPAEASAREDRAAASTPLSMPAASPCRPGSRTAHLPGIRIAAAPEACHLRHMYFASESGWTVAEAERAFDKAVRARGRTSLWHRLTRRHSPWGGLAVHDTHRRGGAPAGVREIPLDAIIGTLEPHRAEQFDREFRPAEVTRERWLRVWLGEMRGAGLPPISVVALGDAYVVRDGRHRVSVARARGAATIVAVVA